MSYQASLPLIQNLALLLATAFLFDVVTSRRHTEQSLLWQVPTGFAIGAIGVIVMLTPWTFGQGIVFDTRSVLLGVSGIFFGTVPTVIAMSTTAAFRFYQGGTGAWTGVAVIITSGVIGIIWRLLRHRPLHEISLCELYILGLMVHLAMLALMLTLPWATALRVLSSIAVPVILIYPLGTVLIGVLMVNRLRRDQAEKTLRESENRYRSLFNNSIDAVLLTAPDGTILSANPAACRMFGHTEEAICRIGRAGLMDMTDPRLPAALEKRALTGQFRGELNFVRKNGSSFPGEISSVIFTDHDGKQKTSVTIRDITERKLGETRQEQFAKIMEFSLNEIYVFNAETLLFEYVNKGALRNLGYTLESMLKMTPVQLNPEFDEASFRQTIAPLLRKEQEKLIFNTVHRRIDGSIYPVEVHLQLAEIEGRRLFLAVIQDITERKKAINDLLETRNYLDSLLEYANAPIIVWDPHLRITRFNRAFEKLTGRKAADVVGKELNLLFPSDSRDASLQHIRQTTTGKRWEVIEIPILHADGSVHTVLWNSAAIYSPDGSQIIAIIAQGQDITERKKAEDKSKEQLQELQRWYEVMLGRENRVLELKKEINDLLTQAGQPPRYMSTDGESEH